MKAKFIEKFYDNEKHPVLVYEYRGCRYEVIDYGWKGGEPLSWQHKNEQVRIDEELDNPPAHDPNFVPKSAEEGFKIFWDFVNS